MPRTRQSDRVIKRRGSFAGMKRRGVSMASPDATGRGDATGTRQRVHLPSGNLLPREKAGAYYAHSLRAAHTFIRRDQSRGSKPGSDGSSEPAMARGVRSASQPVTSEGTGECDAGHGKSGGYIVEAVGSVHHQAVCGKNFALVQLMGATEPYPRLGLESPVST